MDLWECHARTAARLVCDVTAPRHFRSGHALDKRCARYQLLGPVGHLPLSRLGKWMVCINLQRFGSTTLTADPCLFVRDCQGYLLSWVSSFHLPTGGLRYGTPYNDVCGLPILPALGVDRCPMKVGLALISATLL